MDKKGERLDALRRAKWRKDHAGSRCRLCGGATWERRPYCRRDFNWLRGWPEFATAAAAGERLDECDALITLRSQIKVFAIESGGRWVLGDGRQVFKSTLESGQRVFRMTDGGTVVGEFPDVMSVVRYLLRHRSAYNMHNRFATKMLIR